MEPSTPEIVCALIALVSLIFALNAERIGKRKGFNTARRLASQEAKSARALAVSARENGYRDIAEKCDAQANALRCLSMQLEYEMASQFLDEGDDLP